VPLALGMGPAAGFLTQTHVPKRFSNYSPIRHGAKFWSKLPESWAFLPRSRAWLWGRGWNPIRTWSVLRECRAEGQTSITDRPHPRQEPASPKNRLANTNPKRQRGSERPSHPCAQLADPLPPMTANASSIYFCPPVGKSSISLRETDPPQPIRLWEPLPPRLIHLIRGSFSGFASPQALGQK
jgi:hypothetical protein